jgi:hypothetical protein
MMILSDPPSEVANGCVFGYLEFSSSITEKDVIRGEDKGALLEAGLD